MGQTGNGISFAALNPEYILLIAIIVITAGIVYALNRQQTVADSLDLRSLRKRVDDQGKQIDFLLQQIAELKTWSQVLEHERDEARRNAADFKKEIDKLRAEFILR